MANGQETGIETLRVVIALRARGHDWNAVREFHQGQRSATAFKGRIHDRTPTRLPKHQKALAERGPSIHDGCVSGAPVHAPEHVNGPRFARTRWARPGDDDVRGCRGGYLIPTSAKMPL